MPKERLISSDVNVFGEISKKPSNEKKLNQQEYRSLIQQVKRRPCLWNNYSHDFRNLELTRKLWDEVGAPLDLSGVEAKKKWKNVKDKYRKIMHQQKRYSDVPKPKWSLYDELKFCEDIILPERSRNYKTNNHDEDDGDFNENEFPSSLFTSSLEEEEINKLKMQQTQITEIESSEFLPSASEQSNEDNSLQANSSMIVKQETYPSQVEEEEKSSTFSLPMKQEGDDYHFLMSLLPYIEALNPIEKLELRSKLLADVIEAFKNHEYQRV